MTSVRWTSLVLALASALGGCATGMPARSLRDAGPSHGDAGPTRAHALGDAGAHPDADTGVPLVTCMGTAAVCAALHDRAHDFAAASPMRDGATWDGWSTSLMFRLGAFSRSANTAADALEGSTMLGTDATRAPIGAFHWWALGTTGHVGVDLVGGGTTVFMASRHVHESWGTAIGTSSVSDFTDAADARYLGWSIDYLGQRVDEPTQP
jgi:hypothetical protein